MKIICIGRNYVDHITELSNERPTEPVVFLKPDTALIDANSHFYYPKFSSDVHYELELVFRIGKVGKNIEAKFAHKYIDSYGLGIDFTARDVQSKLKEKGLPWEKAKAWDNSAVVGKWIPLGSLKDKDNVNFALYKNKELVQEGASADMLFPFDYIVSYISNFFSINIGDLIFTGTPAGVGEAVVGDELEGFMEDQNLFTVEVK